MYNIRETTIGGGVYLKSFIFKDHTGSLFFTSSRYHFVIILCLSPKMYALLLFQCMKYSPS